MPVTHAGPELLKRFQIPLQLPSENSCLWSVGWLPGSLSISEKAPEASCSRAIGLGPVLLFSQTNGALLQTVC